MFTLLAALALAQLNGNGGLICGGGPPVKNANIAPSTVTTNFVDAGTLQLAGTASADTIAVTLPAQRGVDFTGIGIGQTCGAGGSGWCVEQTSAANLSFFDGATARFFIGHASGNPTTPASWESTVGSGSNAVQVDTNGARVDFGAGASDYCSSDGTTVTFAGPLGGTEQVKVTDTGASVSTLGLLSGHALGLTNGSLGVRGAVADGAANTALDFGSANALTRGVDRFIGRFWRDNFSTVASRINTDGSYSHFLGTGATATGGEVGILCESATSTGNGGSCASGVDLITCSIPANALVDTNRCLRITAYGITANNATAKNLDLALGATPTVLVTKALTVSIAGTWRVEATICRTGSSLQHAYAEAWNNQGTALIGVGADGATVVTNTNSSTPNFTETSAQSLRVRCITNANAANDIVQKGLTVEAF